MGLNVPDRDAFLWVLGYVGRMHWHGSRITIHVATIGAVMVAVVGCRRASSESAAPATSGEFPAPSASVRVIAPREPAKPANLATATAPVLLPDALVVGSGRVCLRTEKAKFECAGSAPEVIAETERLLIRYYDNLYRRDAKGRWYASESDVDGTFGTKAEDASRELLRLRGATDVVLGESSRCFLRGGLVYCWGQNSSGQLGYRSPDPDCYFMRSSVPCSLTPRVVPQVRNATQIAGEDLRCARLSDGHVKCWGAIHEERAANGIRVGLCEAGKPCAPPPPTTIVGLPPIEQMAVGDAGLGVDGAGDVWQWGHRAEKKDRFAAERLSEFSNVARIRTAEDNSGCALYKNGTVACWKPAGKERHIAGDQEAPVKQLLPVAELSDAVDIGAAKDIACAQRRDGIVWCWGASAQALCVEKGQAPEMPCRVPVPAPH